MANSIVILGLGLALLITTLLIRTILLTSKQVQVDGRLSNVSIDRNEAARRLSHAIQFKTILHSDETQFDKAAFIDFQNYIEQAFPLVHAQLTKEIINQYSLLYTWKGQDENLKPMLLMGHLDVVPVLAGTDKEWVYPPFEGRIADGYIWGRGAMDDKASVFGILEAVEILLVEEFKPQQLTPGFAQPLPRQYFNGHQAKHFTNNSQGCRQLPHPTGGKH